MHDNNGRLFDCEKANLEKPGSIIYRNHIRFFFFFSSKVSVPVLVHGFSGISWSITSSPGCWVCLLRQALQLLTIFFISAGAIYFSLPWCPEWIRFRTSLRWSVGKIIVLLWRCALCYGSTDSIFCFSGHSWKIYLARSFSDSSVFHSRHWVSCQHDLLMKCTWTSVSSVKISTLQSLKYAFTGVSAATASFPEM